MEDKLIECLEGSSRSLTCADLVGLAESVSPRYKEDGEYVERRTFVYRIPASVWSGLGEYEQNQLDQ